MSFAGTVDRLLAPADRLAAALADPARRERTAALLLAGYALVWALYGAIAKGSQDIHFDMGEMVGWSRELAWGYPKHPPLSAWLVRGWFSVFPVADWSYYLFAMMVATLGLWIAWLLSVRYLDPGKRIAGLALLTFVPFFGFHALKFNANTVLIPVWAATTLWFLRSLETRSLVYAALAGAAAGAAMLGKYWSVMLLAGLAVAAFSEQNRKLYFRSAAPWVTVAAGALVLAPHVAWLAARDFSAFDYAMRSHTQDHYWQAVTAGFGFLAGTAGYVALPIALVIATARPGKAALADTLWPAEPARRTALVAFVVPILLPFIAAVAAKSEVVSIWTMSAMTLLPVVLLSSPLLVMPRSAVVRLLALAVAFPLLMVLASPLIAFVIHQRGVPNNATHYQLLAAAMEKAWRETTDRPLRFVGGHPLLTYGTAFYLSDRPLPDTELDDRIASIVDAAQVAREGLVMACVADDRGCVSRIVARAASGPPGRRAEVEIVRSYLGVPGPRERYLIVTVPPRS